jgi:predicted permease
VVNAVLLRPLTFSRPDEVVRLYAQNPDASQPRFGVSYADFVDWQRQTHSFTDVALFGSTTLTITSDGEPERLAGLAVTSNFFSLLGVAPALGHLFSADDQNGDASSTIVLSNGLWKQRFGGDSAIIGRAVQFGGRARTVIGVLPAQFALDGRTVDAAIVIAPSGVPDPTNHGQHMFETLGRLKPGVTVEQAHQDLRAVAAKLAATYPTIKDWTTNVFSFEAEMVRGTRDPLLILFAAAGLVLLIGCINVANLLSVRAASRGREVGLRQALGASRPRLVSQLLVESGVLAMMGGALGVVIAVGGMRVMRTLVPPGSLPRFQDVGLDGTMLAFAAGVSVLTAFVVGLWPALRATSPALTRALREGGRAQTGGAHGVRVRRALVVAELSVALVLLVCSGLVLQSLYNILGVDPGFRSDNVSTMRLSLGGPRFASDTASIQFYREFLSRLEQRPGIEAAAAANTPPIAGGGIITPIHPMGRVAAPNEQLMSPVTAVTPGYLHTMSIRLIRGRDVSWTDPAPTLLASEAAAKRLWPGEDPIGKHIAFGRGDPPGLEVVGLVSDTRARGLTTDPVPMLYMSYAGAVNVARTMSLVVRGAGGTPAVVATTRAVLKELDPSLPVYGVSSVREVLDQSIAQPRLNTTLLTIFASLALVLAGIGIYGVVSFSVNQRVQEFGVRMALGAQRADVLRLVLREGAMLAGIGIVLGTAGAIAATASIRTWLYGIERGDPVTFVATAVTLGAIALAAAYFPARRATRVDPVLAMRGE